MARPAPPLPTEYEAYGLPRWHHCRTYQTVPSSTAAVAGLVSNPAYDRWYDQDQHVLRGILSSMSEEIFHDVVAATTSKDAWDTLQRMFSSSTCAHTVQICNELATSKKCDLSAADYFCKIKGLATELVVTVMVVQGMLPMVACP